MTHERNTRLDRSRRVRRALGLLLFMAWPLSGSGQTGQPHTKWPAMKPDEHVWVTSWATAPVPGTAAQAGLVQAGLAGTSESGSQPASLTVNQMGSHTLRQQMRVSLGGDEWRLELTNEFGTEALVVDDVRLALSADRSSSEISGVARAVTFDGAGRVTIPPGALILSDPIAFTAAPLARMSVSLHLPAQMIKTVSWHYFTDQTNWIAAGDVAGEPSLKDAKSTGSWAFVKGLEVRAPAGAATVVAFGDSITEGVHSTRDGNRRWPDLLAERLAGQSVGQKVRQNIGVANEGIGGNRILSPGAGPGALARFDRDVLARAAVRFLIVLEGINDIGNMPRADTLEEAACTAKAKAMIGGLMQMIERAHRRGIKVYGATILPFEGAAYFTEGGEQVRQQVNTWIRTAGAFDAVVDLDRVMRDPAHPARLLPAYDPGDHLHPNDAGYKAMADSVDLRLFQTQ